MLTVVVVDDVVALVVIAAFYSGSLHLGPLGAALLFYVAVLALRGFRFHVGLVYFVFGACAWVALLKSGVEPVVIGLAMGVLAYAYPAQRSSLERATERFRDFRARAFTSPISLGILLGYALGKPVGVVGGTWLATRLSRGRLRPPVGWA